MSKLSPWNKPKQKIVKRFNRFGCQITVTKPASDTGTQGSKLACNFQSEEFQEYKKLLYEESNKSYESTSADSKRQQSQNKSEKEDDDSEENTDFRKPENTYDLTLTPGFSEKNSTQKKN